MAPDDDGRWQGAECVVKGEPILRVTNIEVLYHEVILALKGVSLAVPPDGVVALLGANGAGKSTTLKAISGLLKHENGKVAQGTIEFLGERIDRRSAEEIARLGIIQVIEGRRVFEHLTVEQNLRVGAHQAGNGAHLRRGLELVYHYFPRLKDLRQVAAGYVSGGEQQMTVIGRALVAGPRLLLLDEPSMGLAPLLIHEIFAILARLNQVERIPILLVEQNAKLALAAARYAYVLENGRVVMDGPSETLRENPDVRDFYLGLTDLGTRKSFRAVKHYKRRKRWVT
ncbi:MAG: ABC transporter ATP-binding protein [Deltaproteobacteria bacterium]|nr:ABC transporter ATP-binding protein [Deltaproteobacteria bacterium]MBI3076197.1 ABC transporter ATP-binding protein [Deltaproteobacteria bacterium]